jgi:hypothetical protein
MACARAATPHTALLLPHHATRLTAVVTLKTHARHLHSGSTGHGRQTVRQHARGGGKAAQACQLLPQQLSCHQ